MAQVLRLALLKRDTYGAQGAHANRDFDFYCNICCVLPRRVASKNARLDSVI